MTTPTTCGERTLAGPSSNAEPAELAAVLDEIELTTVDDPDRAYDWATTVEESATALGAEELRLRALLVRADVDGRRGRTVAGARTLRWVNRWATERQHRHLMARSHRLLSMFFDVIGDDVANLEHALRAVELLDPSMRPRMHADHLMGLAIVQGRTGAPEAGRENLAVAEQIATRAGHTVLMARIINNLAYLEYQAGEHDSAVRASERLLALLALLAEHGIRAVPPQADTVARAYLEVGRFGDAEDILRTVVADEDADIDLDGFADPEGGAELLLTLAEVQRRRGDHDRADATLHRCRAICVARGLEGVLVRVRLEHARLYAARELFREAYAELTAYVAEAQQVNSAARDARARMLQTVFEAEEARRTSERYQEMAHRDPLTGLRNRRYVDGRLPELLEPDAEGRGVLSAAFIDLDHFKRINDTLSHEVGDEVLRQVAELLVRAAGADGFAARMGGEEFLLVLPNADAAQAQAVCDRLQATIREHDWAPVTGDLPVRASIGLTTAPLAGRPSQAALLGDADARVYVAKDGGRDRVVSGWLGQPR